MRRALIAALVTLCACSGSSTDANNDGIGDGTYNPNDITLIAPSNPKGNLAGWVLDADGAPVAGASVALSIAGVNPASTDSAGHFNFSALSAGSVVGVTISKGGYTTAYAQATIPSAAGNVPINDATAYIGPVRLFARSATLSVTVVGFDGQPLAPKGSLQISPAYVIEGGGNPVLGGWTVVNATGASGTITFSGLPDLAQLARLAGNSASLSLAIDPIDLNNDGTYEYGGATLSLRVTDVLTSPGRLQVVLPPPSQSAGALQISASSCNTLVTNGNGGGGPGNSLINPGDKVFVAFNQPVVEGSVVTQALDDDGTPIDATVNLAPGGTVADIAAPFPAGHVVTLTITATAAESRPASPVTFGGACFVAPSGTAPTITNALFAGPDGGSLQYGQQVHLELDSAIGSNSAGSPVLSAYIDADVDGDGLRESVGELPVAGATNDSAGFTVSADPSKPTELNGRFTRFLVFTYLPGGIPQALPPSRAVHLFFDDSRTFGTTADSWVNGAPLGNGAQIVGVLRPDGT